MSARAEEKENKEAAKARLLAFYTEYQALMEKYRVTMEEAGELDPTIYRDDATGHGIEEYEIAKLYRKQQRDHTLTHT